MLVLPLLHGFDDAYCERGLCARVIKANELREVFKLCGFELEEIGY